MCASYEHPRMLLLCQYGIVGLEFVLFKEFLSTGDLEVEKGISHTKDLVGHGGCDGKERLSVTYDRS